ncbi:MAG: hypothetical protein PVF20_06195 [Desulfobacterales bacterium]|jgi:hypothetical protein
MTADGYIKMAVLENAIETQLLTSILDEQNIPHLIRSHHDTAYDGLFQFQKGWADLLAPPEYRVAVMEIMASLRSPGVDPPSPDAPSSPAPK